MKRQLTYLVGDPSDTGRPTPTNTPERFDHPVVGMCVIPSDMWERPQESAKFISKLPQNLKPGESAPLLGKQLP